VKYGARKRTEESRLAAELGTLADIRSTQNKFETCANEYAEVVKLGEKLVAENDYSILRPLYRLERRLILQLAAPPTNSAGVYRYDKLPSSINPLYA
jgi:hypothetical protein